jgi:hypothetical protein
MKAFGFQDRKSKLVALSLALITLVAWAKTWGPFYVSSAGANYVNTTFAMDQETEWEVAYVLASMYLWKSTSLTDAVKKSIIGNDDVIRVVYADGQIADFTAADMTTAGMRLKQKVSTISSKDYFSPTADERCAAHMSGQNSITLDTGYYGTIGWDDGPDGEVITTGGWIGTGTVTITIPANINCY